MKVHAQTLPLAPVNRDATLAAGKLPNAPVARSHRSQPTIVDTCQTSSKWPEPTLDDPSLQHYVDSRAPLGLDKIDFQKDVLQGLTIEDCYFAAPVAAIACFRPELIRQMMHENTDGSVSVRFFKCNNPNDAEQTFTPVTVTISRKVVASLAGKDALGHAAGKKLWYTLLEKAYAQFKGGYPAISHRGLPEVALGALLGKPVLTFDPLPDALFDRMTELTHNKQAAIVVWGKDRVTPWCGIQDRHCYSVLKTRVVNGERRVTLRNTFGFGEPMQPFTSLAKDGKNDGIFEISFEEMVRYLPIYRECALTDR